MFLPTRVWVGPRTQGAIVRCGCLLTGFDRPVFTCSSGSNVFEIEIYKSILFLHRCRRLPPVPSLPFHASFRRHAAVSFTFAGPLRDAGPLPSARMLNHYYICCQIRCIEICIYEYIALYVCERGGGQEESLDWEQKPIRSSRPHGPLCFSLPHSSISFTPFSFIFLCLLLSSRWYQLSLRWPLPLTWANVTLLTVSCAGDGAAIRDGGGGSFGMRGGKRPSVDASWRSGKFERKANWGSSGICCFSGAGMMKKGWGGGQSCVC